MFRLIKIVSNDGAIKCYRVRTQSLSICFFDVHNYSVPEMNYDYLEFERILGKKICQFIIV
jgi:hypothetical protein